MVKAGVLGATGYTGRELVRLLSRHPEVEICLATSESSSGKKISDIFPTLVPLPLESLKEADYLGLDLVFLCLPHLEGMREVPRLLNSGVKVIDLSADFRLKDPSLFAETYRHPHSSPELLNEAVYGLTEFARESVRGARLIANPGCYPTATLLGLLPALQSKIVDLGSPLIVDAKSGVSGAGRKASLNTHFVEVSENLSPYSVGRSHRHVPEMEEGFRFLVPGMESSKVRPRVIFNPHLVPLSQGMLCTLYFRLNQEVSEASLRAIYEERYADETFIRVLPESHVATVAHSLRTNYCTLSIHVVDDYVSVVSSIDNLLKGASGQAVQNMNLSMGFEESTGLL